MGRSWGQLGPSRGHLGQSWGHLGPYWCHLGRTWGHLGAILVCLGVILGSLGLILDSLVGSGEAKNIDFPKVFEGFWPLGGVLGRLRGHLGPSSSSLGAFLGPSWGSSGESGRSIGAILEAIDQNRVWHLLAAPRRGPKQTLQLPAKPPLQAQGEGVGGGVNPSPKGKKGVE